LLYPNWSQGRDCCVDISVTNFLLPGKELLQGEAIRARETSKYAKYEKDVAEHKLFFKPFVMDYMGGFGKDAMHILKRLPSAWVVRDGFRFDGSSEKGKADCGRRLMERLSVQLVRSQASSIMERCGHLHAG
jgi:hypothetical protein